MLSRSAVLCLCLGFASAACRTPAPPTTVKEAPTGDNELHWWGLETMRYDDLPAAATLSHVPWAGDYWATMHGGISFRWQEPFDADSEDYKDFIYAIPTAAKLAQMTTAQLNKLSPAEKYDVWQGRTDLKDPNSATGRQRQFMLNSAKWNKDNLGEDSIPSWTGICNGWSLAAINEPYPKQAVTQTLADGRKITFYPDDINALASQIYFDYQPAINVARLGAMCDEAEPATNASGRVKSPLCRDVNPMSFHIALARYLAKDRPFVFDVEPAEETWNQPIYGYELELKNKRPITESYHNEADGTTQLVDAHVTIQYVKEARPLKAGRTPAQLKEYLTTEEYRYTLEMDDAGTLLGGEWKKDSAIPDFLWRPEVLPTDDLLRQLDPSYPLSYAKVKELITIGAAGH